MIFEPDLKEHREQALRISERSIPSRENKWRGLRQQCAWRVKDNPEVSLAGAEGDRETLTRNEVREGLGSDL